MPLGGARVSIEADEVRRIAALARLDLDDATVERFREQLGAILGYVATLDDLGAPPDEPGASGRPAPLPSGLRPDEIRPSLPIDEAVRDAPDTAAGFFRVPRVLGE
jgi:aspartyl-tRNA(Asn)/glutamyl-tRNA(Gln) amidotransferase subunit C